MRNAAIVLSVLLASCMNSKAHKNDVLKAPGVQEIKIGAVQMTTRLMPRKENEDGSILYFNVRIDKPDEKRFEKDKILYLDFDMLQDFVLDVDQHHIIPSICQKVENGKANSFEYIVAFEASNKDFFKKELTLVYNDKVFGIGKLAFVYNPSDTKNFEPKS
jgi:hypothetical protein